VTRHLSDEKAASSTDIHACLAQALPLLPFLESLNLPNRTAMSRRVLEVLTSRDGAENLRIVRGLTITNANDLFLQWLRASPNLEDLEIGIRPHEDEDLPSLPVYISASLLRLHTLIISTLPSSCLAYILCSAELPSLRDLTLPPCPHASFILEAHGANLQTLTFESDHSSWPPVRYTTPSSLLHLCPSLLSLTLTYPLPALSFPSSPSHLLQSLTIPAPRQDHAFLNLVESNLHLLPSLKTLRARDVRWLKLNLGGRAMEAGIQGELQLWKKRLGKKGIKLLDADGWDGLGAPGR
jgi:hypothetical protein